VPIHPYLPQREVGRDSKSERDFSCTQNGVTGLLTASKKGHCEAVRLLLAGGADVEAVGAVRVRSALAHGRALTREQLRSAARECAGLPGTTRVARYGPARRGPCSLRDR
jgi:hypothetical protein